MDEYEYEVNKEGRISGMMRNPVFMMSDPVRHNQSVQTQKI